jgi:hypothetical protein
MNLDEPGEKPKKLPKIASVQRLERGSKTRGSKGIRQFNGSSA